MPSESDVAAIARRLKPSRPTVDGRTKAKLRATLEAHGRRPDDLKSHAARVRALADVVDAASDADDRIDDLEDQVADLEAERDRLAEERDAARERAAEAEQRVDELESDLESVKERAPNYTECRGCGARVVDETFCSACGEALVPRSLARDSRTLGGRGAGDRDRAGPGRGSSAGRGDAGRR